MTSFRIRPRFRFTSSLNKQAIQQRVLTSIDTSPHHFTHKVIQGHIVVRIPPEEQHFWSPQLDIELEEMPEGKTLIRGLYGPNPQIWTLFIFMYGSILLSIAFLLIYEGAQYSLGIIAAFSWWIPILLGIGMVLYIISQLGQKLGAEQTFAMHHLLEDTFHNHIDIE